MKNMMVRGASYPLPISFSLLARHDFAFVPGTIFKFTGLRVVLIIRETKDE